MHIVYLQFAVHAPLAEKLYFEKILTIAVVSVHIFYS